MGKTHCRGHSEGGIFPQALWETAWGGSLTASCRGDPGLTAVVGASVTQDSLLLRGALRAGSSHRPCGKQLREGASGLVAAATQESLTAAGPRLPCPRPHCHKSPPTRTCCMRSLGAAWNMAGISDVALATGGSRGTAGPDGPRQEWDHSGMVEQVSEWHQVKVDAILSKQHASQVLVRKRRANSPFEEVKAGNLERECIEELCNKEEAREIFENYPETEYFYPKYLDVDECSVKPSICGTAVCKNTPGDFECECAEGYRYSPTSKSCEGRVVVMSLLMVKRAIPMCLPLNLEKNYELLYLAEQFIGVVLYLKFRLPDSISSGTTPGLCHPIVSDRRLVPHLKALFRNLDKATFDFRTYDSEGVILYTEALDHSAWLLIALRDGKLEIQFKNEHTTQITTGGQVINNGLWHMVSVEELEQSISVKIAREAIMNINKPESLFKSTGGFVETKVYFAGLPRTLKNTLIKPINPRLDGCMRGWNLMNQGTSRVDEIIQERQNKHCFITVEKGSYYPGSGVAQFSIDYKNISNPDAWHMDVFLNIRPSTGTGVMFALVSGDTVPFALSLVDSSSEKLQDILVSVENTVISRIEALSLCSSQQSHLEFRINRTNLELLTPLKNDIIYSEDLQREFGILDKAMKGTVATYLGGLPVVPFSATPVTAFFNGCMEVNVNGVQLDLDEAVSKHNDIRAHT
ncbi:hypothetical protein QTO34_014346, partial [Cnephaeus nilssonii]